MLKKRDREWGEGGDVDNKRRIVLHKTKKDINSRNISK
jgi:hypothetical protein